MRPKKQMPGGELADDSDQESTSDQTQSPVTGQADSEPKPADAPLSAEPAPKAESKLHPKAKTKDEPAPASTTKPAEPKSMAEVMKVDLRRRKRRRF